MREVQRLQAMNINKIILISHLQSINEDLDMVPYLSGIDVIIAGGGDEVLANPGHLLVPGDESRIFGPYPLWATDASGVQVPVVTTAGSYAYVGRLIAGFDKAGNLIRIDERSGPVRVAGGNQPDAVPADPEVQALVVEPLIAALDEMDNNVIATSEVPLDGLRVNVRSRETNLGSLAADALRWQASQLAGVYGVPVPQVAFQNGGGIRNNTVLPPGNLTELDTFSVLPFANFVSVVQGVTREQFKEILENAVSRVERGDGRFAQISGFRFTWNPAGTAQVLDADGNVTTVGSRVVNATLDDGTVIIADGSVVPGPALTVATIDFLARGGDQYPFRGAPFTTVGVTYQQALQNYLQSGLGGLVTATQYPDGGAGRITRLP
jgi:5'-nucleotidase